MGRNEVFGFATYMVVSSRKVQAFRMCQQNMCAGADGPTETTACDIII